jgi:hypothetical protein
VTHHAGVEAVIALVIVAAAIVVAVITTRRGSPRAPSRPADPKPGVTMTGGEVVLDIDVDDPTHPAVERMVQQVASRALTADPSLDEVVVKDRDGTVLGVVARPHPSDLPPLRDEPRPPPRRARSRGPHMPETFHPDVDLPEIERRPIAERYELPAEVREHLRDPSDPADLVAALLRAGGHDVRRDADVVVAGDTAIVLVGSPHSPTATSDDLGRAFLHFQRSGAARGIALALSYVSPTEERRREAMAPQLRYVDRDAIQRMADAVALGADPLMFITPPVMPPAA